MKRRNTDFMHLADTDRDLNDAYDEVYEQDRFQRQMNDAPFDLMGDDYSDELAMRMEMNERMRRG